MQKGKDEKLNKKVQKSAKKKMVLSCLPPPLIPHEQKTQITRLIYPTLVTVKNKKTKKKRKEFNFHTYIYIYSPRW